jgi:hypothetical protein
MSRLQQAGHDMAERFGGKFSPDNDRPPAGGPNSSSPNFSGPNFSGPGAPGPGAPGPYQGARRTRAGGRVNLLFIAPLPLIWQAFTSPPILLAQYLGALGLLLLAAWLTREGLLAQEAYEARKVARRPALPRKIIGSVLTGAGLAVAGLAGFGVIEAAVFAVLGVGLHFAAFGPDPLQNKGMAGVDEFQTDRVARAVDEGEKHLKAMSEAIARTGDRALMRRLEGFQSAARVLFRTVENDPRDLTAARKYLSVYLLGARDAAVKYTDLALRGPNPAAKSDYEALLDDLQQNFAARTQGFLTDDRSDLTVEIEVLRDRLAREGLRPSE